MSGMIPVMPPIFLAAGMAGRRKIPVRAAARSLHGPPRNPCMGRREILARAAAKSLSERCILRRSMVCLTEYISLKI